MSEQNQTQENNQEITFCNSFFVKYAERVLNIDREAILQDISVGGSMLDEVKAKMTKDRDMINYITCDHGFTMGIWSKECHQDDELMRFFVSICPNALKYASENLRNDEALVLEAVKRNGFMLRFASEELKNNKHIIVAAVTNHPKLIGFLRKELQKDPEIIAAAQINA